MKKIALTLLTFLAMTAGALVGLAVLTPSAQAASCFRTVSVSGTNAYGYARPSSAHNWNAYVRTAPTASLCINYARAYGGYYIASVSCAQSSARLTSDSTSIKASNNVVVHARTTSAACGASASWKWHRTVAAEQCVSIQSQNRWDINQSTGSVSVGLALPSHGYFAPATGC